jgi:2-polyprenyl-3-methyl-5-hydroxy-6-metoxy-1,4-benzoquinol methylase
MTTDCWLCGSAAGVDEDLGDLGFVRCAQCGFVFRPASQDELRDVYEGGAYQDRDFAAGYAADDTIDERLHNARVRVGYVQRFARSGKLLDVGAAGGAFVLAAGRAGLDARGIEPSPAFARHARERLGVDVADGRLEDADIEPGSLDVITLWHVLEHVPEPLAALAICVRALRPGGLLVLEVPNLDSVMYSVMGREWTHLDPQAHVAQFTGATLTDALQRAGFTVLATETVAIDAYLSPRERLAPGHLAYRAKLLRHGVARAVDARRHEFLRAVAQA